MVTKVRLKFYVDSHMEYGWNVYGNVDVPLDEPYVAWQFNNIPIPYDVYFDFDQEKMGMYDEPLAEERDIYRGLWVCDTCGDKGNYKGFFRATPEKGIGNRHYCLDCVEIVE